MSRTKHLYLIAEERYNPGSLIPALEKRSFKDRVSIGIETYKQLLYIDKSEESQLKTQLYTLVYKNLDTPEKGIGPEFYAH
jgi:hypothetical protein